MSPEKEKLMLLGREAKTIAKQLLAEDKNVVGIANVFKDDEVFLKINLEKIGLTNVPEKIANVKTIVEIVGKISKE